MNPEGNESHEGFEIISLETLREKGTANPHPSNPATPDDLSMVIYTSGTTGNPKGVPHTHRALLINTVCNIQRIPFTPNDVHIAFLPMAHIMEQFIEALILSVGGSIGFWSGGMFIPSLLNIQTSIYIPLLLFSTHQLTFTNQRY